MMILYAAALWAAAYACAMVLCWSLFTDHAEARQERRERQRFNAAKPSLSRQAWRAAVARLRHWQVWPI